MTCKERQCEKSHYTIICFLECLFKHFDNFFASLAIISGLIVIFDPPISSNALVTHEGSLQIMPFVIMSIQD